jgi:hypothetical protein
MKKAIVFVINSAFGLILIFVNLAFFASLFITYTRLQENIIFSAVFLTWIIAAIQSRKRRAVDLKGKGLTLDDVDNIKFVKKWRETREKGPWSYCLKDGAAICGSILFLVLSLLAFLLVFNFLGWLEESLANMFQFIGFTYISAAVISAVIYRIAWPYNERRFNRLTDPLNHEFSLKTLQQPD